MPIGGHLLVLALLLVVSTVLLRPGDTFTADEGGYAIQVRALDRGSWEYEDRTAPYDPDGNWFPLRNAQREGDRWFAYVAHPVYPIALLASTRALGELAGLYVWGLLGVLGVAASAWLVAAEVDARAGRGAFWLAAASPVAVTGHLVLAHAPSAALAGAALLAALRTRRSPSRRWTAVLVLALAGGALLRSEAVLFGAALALALVLVPDGARNAPASPGRRFRLAGAVVVTVSATTMAEKAWIGSILGEPYRDAGVRGEHVASTASSGAGVLDFLKGRLEGAWHSLLQGSHGAEAEALAVVVALAMVGFAAWAASARRPGWVRDVCVGLAVAAVLYGVRLALGPDEAMTGLLAAWPIAMFGAIVGLASGSSRGARLPAVTVALFALAVVATQYRQGGGFEWGGRFFSPAVVPLAVLACLGLLALRSALPGRGDAVLALVAALTVLPVLTGLLVVRNVRPLLGDVVDEVEAGGAPVVVTHSPALPSAAWRTYPEVVWMVAPRSTVVEAVHRVRASGSRVDVVVDRTWADALKAAFPEIRDVTGPGSARLGWRALTLPAGSP